MTAKVMLSFRVTEQEKEIVDRYAQENDLTITEVLRAGITALDREYLKRLTKIKKELTTIQSHIIKVMGYNNE